jgi:Skp family chaperone for outer membrane proteins
MLEKIRVGQVNSKDQDEDKMVIEEIGNYIEAVYTKNKIDVFIARYFLSVIKIN